jgi:adenylate cyclase
MTRDELIAHTGISRVQLDRLVDLGLLKPHADDHDPGDVHRIHLIGAFEAAGIAPEALAAAAAVGTITLQHYPDLYADPGVGGERRYGEFAAGTADRARLLPRVYAAFGLAAPSIDARLGAREEQLLDELVAIASAADEDLVLRAVRLLAESARRTAEAVLTVYEEAADRAASPPRAAAGPQYERLLAPWARMARSTPDLAAWLTERHLSHAIEAYSVAETERMLAAAGHVPPHPEVPVAIAFVDLSGFTQLTIELGDREAASVGLRLGELGETCARRFGGGLVKLLGDGALLRFTSPGAAVDASIELVSALQHAGLPPGHVGIDAGSVVSRDGDVFGRTVNTAARVSDVAPAGEIYVTEEAARYVPATQVAEIGHSDLEGIGPVRLFRVLPGA